MKCWKIYLFLGLKLAKKILIKWSAKMKSTSTPTTNKFPKMLGQGVVASFEVEQSITTGNQAPRLRHATHHLCTRPTSPPQLSLSLLLSTKTPLWPTPCAHTHISSHFHFHFRFQLRPIASLPNYHTPHTLREAVPEKIPFLFGMKQIVMHLVRFSYNDLIFWLQKWDRVWGHRDRWGAI